MIDTLLRARCLAVALLAFVVGCGGGASSSGGATGPTEEATLQDLSALLKTLGEQKKRPPTKLAELDSYEPVFMAAYKGVESKSVVYVWGSAITPGGTAVIAYDAKVEASGGYVLLEDGNVKKMTAAEFAAAPKPAKK